MWCTWHGLFSAKESSMPNLFSVKDFNFFDGKRNLNYFEIWKLQEYNSFSKSVEILYFEKMHKKDFEIKEVRSYNRHILQCWFSLNSKNYIYIWRRVVKNWYKVVSSQCFNMMWWLYNEFIAMFWMAFKKWCRFFFK